MVASITTRNRNDTPAANSFENSKPFSFLGMRVVASVVGMIFTADVGCSTVELYDTASGHDNLVLATALFALLTGFPVLTSESFDIPRACVHRSFSMLAVF